MSENIEFGIGRRARKRYHLRDISITPSRRTRNAADVSLEWQLDAFTRDIPMMAHPSDATMTPESAALMSNLGGIGVLNAEGLWTRYEDPTKQYENIAAAQPGTVSKTPVLQEAYATPVQPELIQERIRQMRAATESTGAPIAVRISPQHAEKLAPTALEAGIDVLIIQGTIISAEHVSEKSDALNLKSFTAGLDIPVVVGGCSSYQTALHLMRTGAAGVIVGTGADQWATNEVLGVQVQMASAIADAAAARRDYLDETGGRYVHVIADGDIYTSGDIARAIACGADAVMLGEALSNAAESPGGPLWWHPAASHPTLPRGTALEIPYYSRRSLEEVLFGPASNNDGVTNLAGALRRTLAKTGYSDLKAFQRCDLSLS